MLNTSTRNSIYIMCILLVMCPKRSHVLATQNEATFLPKLNFPSNWAKKALKHEGNTINNLKSIEPGFDFTEEEMVRLKIWPDAIIPYYIDNLSFDKVLRDRIRAYLELVSGLSGLHFLELPTPPEDTKTRWVFFINRRGQLTCGDHTIKEFTNEGVQKVILGYDCMCPGGEIGDIVLALAGVPPQHNAPNRDEFITVVMENIIPEKKYLFEAVKDNEWLFHGLDYDFSSAGHYNFHKYTTNGSATISPKTYIPTLIVGEGDGLSNTDILKIRMMYNYISKKKSSRARAPDCVKIFEPGTNFSNYQPNNANYQQPRKKPNQFLGLPDDDKRDNNSDSNEISNERNNENEPNQETNDEGDKEKGEDNSDSKIQGEKFKLATKLTYKKGRVKSRILDPLSYLSDYQTDQDRRSAYRHKLKNLAK
ncbi:uncharacterized protein LOC113516701 [Galleria mellonella]|uniref:Metalloendopeptidase n=1 Tax=Galleria mellonella TaxID=7137 RepID=A0ABM3N2K9_GALME|nr:uncharacterized protein LOC113516701 [Galleria mellonella]